METTGGNGTILCPKEFKSYYVVWKQQREYIELCPIRGLNRTMQYGNYLAVVQAGIGFLV